MNVLQIQEELKQLPQLAAEVIHHFSDGCYARELRMPKDYVCVGALHKTNHHWLLTKGKVLIKNGNTSKIVCAPYHGQTKPGDKRAFVAFEDSILTTFHVTELTDVDEIGRAILGEEL